MEGNATNIPLPIAAFDTVVCQQGLQFFPDKLAALHEMRSVLSPGRASRAGGLAVGGAGPGFSCPPRGAGPPYRAGQKPPCRPSVWVMGRQSA